jgi:hypothetical protein
MLQLKGREGFSHVNVVRHLKVSIKSHNKSRAEGGGEITATRLLARALHVLAFLIIGARCCANNKNEKAATREGILKFTQGLHETAAGLTIDGSLLPPQAKSRLCSAFRPSPKFHHNEMICALPKSVFCSLCPQQLLSRLSQCNSSRKFQF